MVGLVVGALLDPLGQRLAERSLHEQHQRDKATAGPSAGSSPALTTGLGPPAGNSPARLTEPPHVPAQRPRLLPQVRAVSEPAAPGW